MSDAEFEQAVVRELAARGERDAVRYAVENANDMTGLGPAEIARDLGETADPADAAAVDEVAACILESYARFSEVAL